MAKRLNYGMKVALDIGMCLVLVLLYKAKVLTLDFHEIAGLAIFALFALHLAFNWKWVVRQGKKLFSPTTPTRTKFSYWLSIALLVSFVLIVVSGIFISKILFKDAITAWGIDTSPWRTVHLFFSAVALILVGMHVGLYWDPVRAFISSRLKMPARVGKIVGRTALALTLAMGVYALATTNFGAWLASPVIPIQHGGHGHGDAAKDGEGASGDSTEADNASGEAAESSSDQSGDAASGHKNGHGASSEGDAAPQGSSDDAAQADAESGAGQSASDDASAQAESKDAGQKQKSGNHGVEITPGNIALTIADFTSIIALFAALTWWVDHRLRRRKKAAVTPPNRPNA